MAYSPDNIIIAANKYYSLCSFAESKAMPKTIDNETLAKQLASHSWPTIHHHLLNLGASDRYQIIQRIGEIYLEKEHQHASWLGRLFNAKVRE
jgi:hypothetical protein